jgi:sarcosine oxidase
MSSRQQPKVAVIGTGTTGAMTLWQLARRGVPAVGFDRYAPGHDRGAGAGETRIFRTAYREGAAYVPLLQRAEQLWRDLEAESGAALLTMSGGLTLGAPDDPDVRMVIDCAERFGLEYEQLDRHEAARRFPEHPLRDGEVAVLDRHAGVLRPEPSVAAAAAAAEGLGATVRRYDPVQEVVPDGDRVVVRSASGEHVFDHVVLAPGPWAGDQGLLDFVPLEVHQITTYWFPAQDPARYAPDRMPIVIRCGEPGYSCFPAVDGLSVKVSLHHVQRPRLGTAEELTRSGPADLLPAMRETVQQFMPGLRPDPVRIGSYADCFSPDGHGLVGSLPGRRNVTVLAGFSGHGFKLSPVLGEIAADLVVDGGTARDIAHLTPSRFC